MESRIRFPRLQLKTLLTVEEGDMRTSHASVRVCVLCSQVMTAMKHVLKDLPDGFPLLTSPEALLLRSGTTSVLPLLPGTIVDPILILGPTNM